MSLRPTRPGEPGFQDWKDLADAVDSVGVLGAGCAEADPHEVEREAFYSSLGAYFLPDGSPRLEGDDDSACAQNRGTNTMNTPEFDFTAEQPNRLFEKWWAEQAEYRHRQTGISEARAIWLCSWRAYGEACRAATPQGEPKQFKPYMGPLTNEGAQSLWETLNDTERHDQTPVHIHFAYALLRRYGPPKEPPAPATGAVLTDERLRSVLGELHALVWGECPSLLDEDSGGNSALDMDIRAILAAKGETS